MKRHVAFVTLEAGLCLFCPIRLKVGIFVAALFFLRLTPAQSSGQLCHIFHIVGQKSQVTCLLFFHVLQTSPLPAPLENRNRALFVVSYTDTIAKHWQHWLTGTMKKWETTIFFILENTFVSQNCFMLLIKVMKES